MQFLKLKVWPVVAGFILASIVMMVFEYINSFIFPLPSDLDWTNTEAVKAFTASLPWTVYILVFLGWITGSFAGGFVAAYLSGESQYRLSLVVGVILTLAGIMNILMLGHSAIFSVISLPMFIIFTYIGYWYALSWRRKSTAQ